MSVLGDNLISWPCRVSPPQIDFVLSAVDAEPVTCHFFVITLLYVAFLVAT